MALGELPEYPWDKMVPYRERASKHPAGLIDLSIGSPIDPTPQSVQDALSNSANAHSYPATAGTVHLREAIVSWYSRRRGVHSLTPDQVLPTIGSKELVAWLPFMLGLGSNDTVVHPKAAYPTYAVGATIAGAASFASDDPAEWPESTKLVWLNSPGNPDGAVLDVEQLREAVVRARELGAVIASDECYAELGWDAPWNSEPVPSILDPRVVADDHTGVLSVYSLSKQSNLAGYRAAFVAGDPAVIERLLVVRKHAGMIPPAPVQSAMVAALEDDRSVDSQRELYRRRREVLLPAAREFGLRIDRSEAGLYLWGTEGVDAWVTIERLAERGIVAGPGHFYGEFYPQHVRLSLTASDTDIREAAERLRNRPAGE